MIATTAAAAHGCVTQACVRLRTWFCFGIADVKPDNILLHGERAVLADFGSALVLPQALSCMQCRSNDAPPPSPRVGIDPAGVGAELPPLRRGLKCGTVNYAAPEALASRANATPAAGSPPGSESSIPFAGDCSARGHGERAGEATAAASADIWALGVTLFATVVGHFPWDVADRAVDRSYATWADCDSFNIARAERRAEDAASSRASSSPASCSSMASALSESSAADLDDAVRDLATKLLAGCDRSISAALFDLLLGMLDPDPATRATMEEVAVHRWFDSDRGCRDHDLDGEGGHTDE